MTSISGSKVEVTSKRFWLNYKDFLRGLGISMMVGGLMVLENSLESGSVNVDHVWKAALAAGIAYLIKNFFQPAQVKQTVTSEEAEAIRTNANQAAK